MATVADRACSSAHKIVGVKADVMVAGEVESMVVGNPVQQPAVLLIPLPSWKTVDRAVLFEQSIVWANLCLVDDACLVADACFVTDAYLVGAGCAAPVFFPGRALFCKLFLSSGPPETMVELAASAQGLLANSEKCFLFGGSVVVGMVRMGKVGK